MTSMNSWRDSAFSGSPQSAGGASHAPLSREQRVEFVEVGLFLEHADEDRLPLPLADGVDDLVLQDAGQPRRNVERPEKPSRAARAATSVSCTTSSARSASRKLQLRDPQQVAAVRVELGGEEIGVHGRNRIVCASYVHCTRCSAQRVRKLVQQST